MTTSMPPHELKIRVYYEDTDFSGLVYHANYLKFCERGRSEMIRAMGVDHLSLQQGKYGEPCHFAVRHFEIDFHAPARMDDLLCVRSSLSHIGGASIAIQQKIRLQEKLLISAQVKLALISAKGKPLRLPLALMEKIERALPGET